MQIAFNFKHALSVFSPSFPKMCKYDYGIVLQFSSLLAAFEVLQEFRLYFCHKITVNFILKYYILLTFTAKSPISSYRNVFQFIEIQKFTLFVGLKKNSLNTNSCCYWKQIHNCNLIKYEIPRYQQTRNT